MADWYASSTAYAAIPAYTVKTYAVGDLVKPSAPANQAKWVFRCTTAGAASTEPTWPFGNNATITTGAAVFTNVTGQSTYGWSAAAGDMPTLTNSSFNRFAVNDRMFVSSDHNETQTANTWYGNANTAPAYGSCQILSVNRAGSVPPVAADLLAGATATVGGTFNLYLDALCSTYHYGMNYISTATSGPGIYFNYNGLKTTYLDTCTIYLNTTNAAARISNNYHAVAVLYNTTIRFGAATQSITHNTSAYAFDFIWLNTVTALAGGAVPTVLFTPGVAGSLNVTMRGVDLSALTTAFTANSTYNNPKFLFDSCRIAPGVTRYSMTNPGAPLGTRDMVELVNCFDGTSFISERYEPVGAVTTDLSTTLVGGATDNVGLFAHKMVSNANSDKWSNPLPGFWIDLNWATVGGLRTATVEIISSASLNNDDISLLLEYEGTLGSSLASFVRSLPATILTAATALPTSSATWNSPPSTPIKQLITVSFTPQTLGRVRARVLLGKPSVTCWYNPQVSIA